MPQLKKYLQAWEFVKDLDLKKKRHDNLYHAVTQTKGFNYDYLP